MKQRRAYFVTGRFGKMTGEKIELIERHARIDRLKDSVKKLEKRAKYLFTVHKIKNAKSEAQIQRVEEKEEKKRKFADLEIMYVFSWPASRLAFGDYSILSAPMLPVSS